MDDGAFLHVSSRNVSYTDLYTLADSTVITLSDWYHYLSKDASGVPAPNSTLINGVGRYPGGPTNNSLAVVNVKAGTRYVLDETSSSSPRR